jgi:RimJ/RimL family protein N-acetyltransferase
MKIAPITLNGKIIRLEPLSLEHVPDLCRVGLDDRIWRFMRYGLIQTSEDMRRWVENLLCLQEKGTDLPFAVIGLESGRAIGATRYMNIAPEHRSLEIGGTWYGIDYQGSGVNIEAKYLMLRHAFEEWRCIRVQIKTDLRNERSQRAIEKIGLVREGVLRNHIILPDGYIRSSVIYSLLDNEWPAVKSQLEARMGYIP